MRVIKKGWWGFIIFAGLIAAVVAAIAIMVCCPKTTNGNEGIRVPIIMYHDVEMSPVCEGDYLISTDTLARDIRKLLEAGFQPISVSQLIDYVYSGSELPQKPVLLTFDDGYKSIQTQVLPLLEKYKIPACVSIIGARAAAVEDGCDSADYMSWKDIRMISKSEYIELVSHSAYLHVYRSRKGVSQLPDEDAAHYQKMLTKDINAMNAYADNEKITLLPVFAYPYGYVEPEAENVFHEQGFMATLTSEEHVNIISRDKDCLFQLGRLNRSAYMSTAQLILWLQNEKGE